MRCSSVLVQSQILFDPPDRCAQEFACTETYVAVDTVRTLTGPIVPLSIIESLPAFFQGGIYVAADTVRGLCGCIHALPALVCLIHLDARHQWLIPLAPCL
jgi:hypothetical protein